LGPPATLIGAIFESEGRSIGSALHAQQSWAICDTPRDHSSLWSDSVPPPA